MRISTLTLAVSLATLALSAQAEQLPNIGNALREVQPPPLPATPAPALPTVGGVAVEPPMQALPQGGPSAEVRAFRIVGNRVISTSALLALLHGEGGKRYTLAELEVLATRLTRYYRTNGYFVARAYVPAQELDNGVLTLRVVEGNYGRFVLDNASRVHNDVVQGLLDNVKHYDIVSLDTLERAMLIINDTPGVKVVKADVMPGEKVGTSDFAIGTEATPAVSGYLAADNYGSVYTGQNRLSGNVDWNSPTGRGDRLSLSGLVTQDADLLNGRLAYSTLVATDGTRAEAAVSQTQYQLGDRYQALGATGTADSLELGVTTPFKRTRESSLYGGLNMALRDLRDDVSATSTSTRKRSNSVTGSLNWNAENQFVGFSGQTQASVSLTAGRLNFPDADARALDAAGSDTQGNYERFNFTVSRITLLPYGLTLSTSLKGQATLSNRNLDGSERMSVSGPGGVIAYPSGELAGDHAAVGHVELQHALPFSGAAQLTASVFGDVGWAQAVRPQGTLGTPRTISDVGLGLGMTLARGGFAKLQVAGRTASAATSESAARVGVLMQVGWAL